MLFIEAECRRWKLTPWAPRIVGSRLVVRKFVHWISDLEGYMIGFQVFRDTGSDPKYCGLINHAVIDSDCKTRVWALLGFGPLDSRSLVDFSELEFLVGLVPESYSPILLSNVLSKIRRILWILGLVATFVFYFWYTSNSPIPFSIFRIFWHV